MSVYVTLFVGRKSIIGREATADTGISLPRKTFSWEELYEREMVTSGVKSSRTSEIMELETRLPMKDC